MTTGKINMEENRAPNYWLRYDKKDHYRLRHQFKNSENVEANWSQSMQDIFVLSMLDGKKNGYYVEIGADMPRIINNSYLLEKNYDWTGVSFELDSEKVEYFNTIRKNKCICTDATTFDYKKLFEERNYPKQIDYLQLDIDPSEATLAALENLPLDDYRFSVITYETEVYRAGIDGYYDEIWQKKSGAILSDYGYELVVKNVANQGNPYEDWWVDPKVVDRAIIEKFKDDSGFTKESIECVLSNTNFTVMPMYTLTEI
jgi:hypothetical protein|tara:strand:+ start:64 stop:837 length:774 start_codon:yes stop_codon:yes gene_type:complete